MRMKKGLIMVVVLLAIASLMAAMAYNKATVTNAAQLKIANTNESLLTLEANTPWSWQSTVGAKDNTVVVKDGELFIQFGKGVDRDGTTAKFYGLQPNSKYEWNPLITLRNKSAETIDITVSANSDLAPYITFGTCTQATVNNPTWGIKGQPLTISNVPKESGSGMQNIRELCVRVEIPSTVNFTPSQITGSIIVDSQAK